MTAAFDHRSFRHSWPPAARKAGIAKRLRLAVIFAAVGATLSIAAGAGAQGIRRNQLIGLWVTSGRPCSDESGIRFRADGRYVTGEGNGFWTLRANRLLLTNWGGGRNVPIALRRDGRLVIRWDYGLETLRRC